uniref:Uncharacterized protein n=1 Tax=Romanomermis culicivorax TaxID=13658 RepID=A0A915HXE3_ROMCU
MDCDREQQRAGGKMRTGMLFYPTLPEQTDVRTVAAKRPSGARRTMSHRRFTQIFSMGSVNWSYDLSLMEQEIARVREAQRAQRSQKAGNPGNAGAGGRDDPALLAWITEQVKAAMAARVGPGPNAARDEPWASTVSSTVGDDQDVALGAEDNKAAERLKMPKHRGDQRSTSEIFLTLIFYVSKEVLNPEESQWLEL